MKFRATLLPALLSLIPVTVANGDTVLLRSGQKIEGTFLGGTVRQLQFQDSTGKTLALPLGDVSAMTFTAPPPPPPPPPKSSGRAIQLPAGTVLHVRIIDAINVDVS